MGKPIKKSSEQIATIDCSLITIEDSLGNEFGFDTANQIQVEPQIDEEDAVKLVIKGILRAQKPAVKTLTGNQIILTDNVFQPELVLILQGGEIVYDADGKTIKGYNPPEAGSSDKGETFKLNAYTAQYDASGRIVKYEKITYPNCQGQPVAFGSEDGAFRAPEYTITSAPKTGERPYTIAYVAELPVLHDASQVLGVLNCTFKKDAGKVTVKTYNPSSVSVNCRYKLYSTVEEAEADYPTASKVSSFGTILGTNGEISVSDKKILTIVGTDSSSGTQKYYGNIYDTTKL